MDASATWLPSNHDPIQVMRSYEFPEDRFALDAAQSARYQADVTAGYHALRNRRLVIAGLARDVAETLPATIARIERLGNLAADYRVIIYENDSADDTCSLLRAWRHRNARVSILSEVRYDPVNLPERCLHRAERMAHYRNQYHAHVATYYPDFDNVVVLDTDLEGGWSQDGVAHTFGQRDWDFVGSYGVIYRRIGGNQNRMHHFDAWAFRPLNNYEPMDPKVVNSMAWRRGDALLPVNSCFGGMGIYRTEAFLAGKYNGSDCEHVPLHRKMKQDGYSRIFLNPNQITLYGRRRRKLDRFVMSLQKMMATCCFQDTPVWH